MVEGIKNKASIEILFVCTANICRSPVAAQMLEQMLESSTKDFHNVTVRSSGVFAQVGMVMHHESALSLTETGFQLRPHLSEQLSQESISSASLILCSTVAHRGEVAKLMPSANAKNFTLLEYARISSFLNKNRSGLGLAGPLTLAEKLKSASELRGYAPPAEGLEDILDPWGKKYMEHAKIASQIKFALEAVTDWWEAE